MRSRAVAQNWETSIRRRRLVSAFFVTATLVAALAAPAKAQARPTTTVDVIEVSGLLDPIQVEFIGRALDNANRDHSAVLVIRLDSRGAVVAQAKIDALAERFKTSTVPVAVWVGPGKEAKAEGAAQDLYAAATIKGKAPQTPTLGDFIVGLADRTGVPTKVVERQGRPPQRQLAPEAQVRFDEPSLLAQMLHAVATPSAAYLLLVVGLLLIVFEFFTGGVGVAGGVGLASFALGAYGLGVLPTRPLALALVAAAILGFAVDVQAGVPRAWTVIGTVAFAVGSFFLFAGGLSVPLVVLGLAVAAIVLFMVAGMPSIVRTRFSTPTIGRESMLGEEGTALSDIDPDGVVTVRQAPWRARTNRATPIPSGAPVRVAAIDGLLLEVEPLEGAAKDAGH
jgi:membrane-bound serine protease (ClpP class)